MIHIFSIAIPNSLMLKTTGRPGFFCDPWPPWALPSPWGLRFGPWLGGKNLLQLLNMGILLENGESPLKDPCFFLPQWNFHAIMVEDHHWKFVNFPMNSMVIFNSFCFFYQRVRPFHCWWYTYPSEKWWSSSVGMIFPNIWKFIKLMFQTTNQFGISPTLIVI